MPRARKDGENRGGPRQGVQGRRYGNRTDLADAPRQEAPQVQAAAMTPAPQAAPVGPPPSLGPDQGSWYPNQPVTHGLSTGPGAGREVLGIGSTPSMDLGAWLRENPHDQDVADVIEILRSMGR